MRFEAAPIFWANMRNYCSWEKAVPGLWLREGLLRWPCQSTGSAFPVCLHLSQTSGASTCYAQHYGIEWFERCLINPQKGDSWHGSSQQLEIWLLQLEKEMTSRGDEQLPEMKWWPQISEDVGVWLIDWLLYHYQYFCFDCDVEKVQTLASGQSVCELWL